MSQATPRNGTAQSQVAIPVTVDGKRFRFAYGLRMPELVNGAFAAIVVDASSITDKYVLKLLQSDQTIDLLLPEERVLIAVSAQRIPDELVRKTYRKDRSLADMGGRHIAVCLETALRLRLSGAKRAAFSGGSCVIPALDGRRAISLNQAFTFISEVFEPERQSHVGNAFKSGLWFNSAAGSWSPLEDLRVAYEARFREYITEQIGITSKKQRLAGPPSFDEWIAGKRAQQTLPF